MELGRGGRWIGDFLLHSFCLLGAHVDCCVFRCVRRIFSRGCFALSLLFVVGLFGGDRPGRIDHFQAKGQNFARFCFSCLRPCAVP